MNKTLTGMVILGVSAALLTPIAPAWAGGGDDSGSSHSGRDDSDNGGRHGRGGDDSSSDSSDDDGTPDQGRGDAPGTPGSGSDDGTPDQGRGDAPGTPGSGSDDGTADQGRGSRTDRNRVEVREDGVCSDTSKWRIRIRVRDDRGRIKFQVKTRTVGERWSYSVIDNGTEILSGSKVTHGSSADFSVKDKWRGVPATSHAVTATAENLTTGETCSGTASA